MLHLQRASAGSGKTYTLTKRFLEFLLGIKDHDGRQRLRRTPELADALRHIMAVTFTNKATAEMKGRIVTKLADLAAWEAPADMPDYMEDFEKDFGAAPEKIATTARLALGFLLHAYSDFHVSTIDSFFQTVLRTFAYESELNDTYQVELDSELLSTQALEATIEEADDSQEDSETGRWLRHFVEGSMDKGSNWNIYLKRGRDHSLWSDLLEVSKKMASEEYKQARPQLDKYFAANPDFFANFKLWDDHFRARRTKALDELKQLARDVLSTLEAVGLDLDFLTSPIPSQIPKVLATTIDQKKFLDFQYAGIHAKLSADVLAVVTKANRKKADLNAIEQVGRAALAFYDGIETCLNNINKGEIKLWSIYCQNLAWLGIMNALRDNTRRYLEQNNLVELAETNVMLSRVIGDDDAPFIYERLGANLNHFLIDEFQDTSSMQWQNLRPLVVESHSRGEDHLIIGDAKQSIYRFRNADSTLITKVVPSQFSDIQTHGNSDEENTNWRSRKRIVEFNNAFFSRLAPIAAEKGGAPEIPDVYSNVEQLPHQTDELGYVEVNFMGKDQFAHVSRSGNEEPDLEWLYELLQHLLDRGYRQKDIAVLVRGNTTGKYIVNAIMQYNATQPEGGRLIELVSEELLYLATSLAVTRIVKELKDYSEGAETSPDDAPPVLALPALVEHIIATRIPQEQREAEAPYIAAFQDALLDYCERFPTDIASFLLWWRRASEKLTISAPEGTDAVNIMTIHKSKGLEFKVCIVPEVYEGFVPDPKYRKEWRWVEPRLDMPALPELPPFVPIETVPDLKDTLHEDAYNKYAASYAADVLNSLYVAFTRAIDELYIYIRDDSGKPAGNATGIYHIVKDLIPRIPGMKIEEPDLLYTYGEPVEPKHKKEAEKAAPIDSYSSAVMKYKLRLKSHPIALDVEDDDEDPDPRSGGNLLHGILARVSHISDLHRSVQMSRSQGLITGAGAEEFEKLLRSKIAAMPQAREWFEGDWRVINERSLLVARQKDNRPDRIMVSTDADGRQHAIVVDYKFGKIPEGNKHRKQVADYMSLLKSTGRFATVRGYLWYVTHNHILPIPE